MVLLSSVRWCGRSKDGLDQWSSWGALEICKNILTSSMVVPELLHFSTFHYKLFLFHIVRQHIAVFEVMCG